MRCRVPGDGARIPAGAGATGRGEADEGEGRVDGDGRDGNSGLTEGRREKTE
jgi:hypothetical protein